MKPKIVKNLDYNEDGKCVTHLSPEQAKELFNRLDQRKIDFDRKCVVGVEDDPYRSCRDDLYSRIYPRIFRKIYEDSSRALFINVPGGRVCSIRYQNAEFPDRPNAMLELEDGATVCVTDVSPQEFAWFHDSMEDTI